MDNVATIPRLFCALLLSVCAATSEQPTTEVEAARKIRGLDGRALLNLETGRISEINLNGNARVTDETMALVAACPEITDLNLEATGIGDAGLQEIAGLERLEWLNLYRTRVSDAGLEIVGHFARLQQLPIGETRITDAGLVHLAGLRNLRYLGLRGTAVTDAGVKHLEPLTNLTGLHLGQTRVTDRALHSLENLTKLEKLWLHDTPVTGGPLRRLLGKLPVLKELHIERTHLEMAEVRQLRETFPNCRISYEKDDAR